MLCENLLNNQWKIWRRKIWNIFSNFNNFVVNGNPQTYSRNYIKEKNSLLRVFRLVVMFTKWKRMSSRLFLQPVSNFWILIYIFKQRSKINLVTDKERYELCYVMIGGSRFFLPKGWMAQLGLSHIVLGCRRDKYAMKTIHHHLNKVWKPI